MLSNTSYTLPAAHRRNISCIALNPQGNLLLTVDEEGHAILTHFLRRIVLHHLSFKNNVTALTFSPSGCNFAVAIGRFVEVWHTPSTPDASADGVLDFAPFVRHHRHAGHHDTVQNISWSTDSRFLITTSKDLSARVWSLNPEEGFVPTVLSGHRQEVKAAWFSDNQETVGGRYNGVHASANLWSRYIASAAMGLCSSGDIYHVQILTTTHNSTKTTDGAYLKSTTSSRTMHISHVPLSMHPPTS